MLKVSLNQKDERTRIEQTRNRKKIYNKNSSSLITLVIHFPTTSHAAVALTEVKLISQVTLFNK